MPSEVFWGFWTALLPPCLTGQETEILIVWQTKHVQQQSSLEEELPHLLVGVNYSGFPGGEQLQEFP